MTIQKVENKYKQESNFVDHPNIDYVEIKGIKLRDSIFIVYPQDSSYEGPEFIYSLKSLEDSVEMVFDYDEDKFPKNKISLDSGLYEFEDHRVLYIKHMDNWHFRALIFSDINSWIQYSKLNK